MSIKYFDFTPPKFFLFTNQSKRLNIPQSHIFIFASRSLVVLCGQSGLSPTPEHCET
jgi:hypothetical protein